VHHCPRLVSPHDFREGLLVSKIHDLQGGLDETFEAGGQVVYNHNFDAIVL
jgi:hypothetical protein